MGPRFLILYFTTISTSERRLARLARVFIEALNNPRLSRTSLMMIHYTEGCYNWMDERDVAVVDIS